MINNTNNNIRYISFKFFLEKGYEATNIRDICLKVGIKPSSLYFYYKSKIELFFSIYDEVWNKKIKYMNNIEELEQNISPKIKFYHLYKKMIEFYVENIVNEKFLLRYHLFPAEEISNLIKDRFNYWMGEENNIILDIINQCFDEKLLDTERSQYEYLQEYKRFVSNLIIEMLIYNIKISSDDIDMLWNKFWDCRM